MTASISSSDRAFARRVLILLADVGTRITADLTDDGIDPYVVRNSPMATLMELVDGPLRPVELAERVGMTSGGMTKVIDRLEERGLLERDHEVEEDGRGVLVSLTTEGRRTAERVLDSLVPTLRKAVEDLSSFDR